METHAAGWFPDPTQRHQFRWWTGSAWSDHVADGGVVAVDPLAPPTPIPQQTAPFQHAAPFRTPIGYQSVAAPPARPAAADVGWVTLAGAVVAGLSSVLEWLDSGFSSANGFDVPFVFLLDYKSASDSGFTVGLVIGALAVVALAGAFVRQPAMRQAGRIVGGLLTAIGAVYIVQIYRLVDEANVSISDVIGVAPDVAIAGGVTVLVAAGR